MQLYDAVEAASQELLRSKPEPKEAAAAAHLFEELRLRFSRLVCGVTPVQSRSFSYVSAIRLSRHVSPVLLLLSM